MNISFIFRKPLFPLICDLDGFVIAARSKRGLEKQLSKHKMSKDSFYSVIDRSGEGWALYPKLMVISPLTTKKRWFKKEVIGMYNNRKNNASNTLYSEKSLSAKRFDTIFTEIVELLIKNC